MSNSHNHEDCIGCGCYNPAIDILLGHNKSNNASAPVTTSIQPKEEPKYALFHNGRIYPVQKVDANGTVIEMEDTIFYYEAMEIEGGMIKWLGSNEEALARPTVNKEVIDLKGKTILPGLIEPHCHIVPSAAVEFGKIDSNLKPAGGSRVWKNYAPFDGQFLQQSLVLGDAFEYSRANLLTAVIDEAKSISLINLNLTEKEKPFGPLWLLGNGVDPSLMKEVYPDEQKTIINCIGSDFFAEIDADHDRDHQIGPDKWYGDVPPILLVSASGHTAYANKIALGLAWHHAVETKNNAFLNAYDRDKNRYVTDENCVLQELVEMGPVLAAISPIQIQSLQSSLKDSIQSYIDAARKVGVTMMYDAGMKQKWAEDFFINKMADSKEYESIDRGIRIGMSVPYAIEDTFDAANQDLKGFFNAYLYEAPTSESLNAYWGSVKITSDGSNQGLTGYQSEKYVCPCLPAPNEKGVYNFETQAALEKVNSVNDPLTVGIKNNNSVVEKIVEKGWPLLIHANGNEAIEYTINAYKKAQKNSKVSFEDFRKMRHRIEHCSLLNEQNLEDMQELGIQPSFLIGHVGYWGDVFDNYIFPTEQPENSAFDHLDKCKSALDASLHITLHSDNAVSPLGPLRCMEQAYTRIMEGSTVAKEYYRNWRNWKKNGGKEPTAKEFESLPVLNKAERIGLVQALKAITIDAAWQCQADELVGSLLPGKLADFVVLESDPMQMDTRHKAYLNMRNVKVKETWVGGIQYTNT